MSAVSARSVAVAAEPACYTENSAGTVTCPADLRLAKPCADDPAGPLVTSQPSYFVGVAAYPSAGHCAAAAVVVVVVAGAVAAHERNRC